MERGNEEHERGSATKKKEEERKERDDWALLVGVGVDDRPSQDDCVGGDVAHPLPGLRVDEWAFSASAKKTRPFSASAKTTRPYRLRRDQLDNIFEKKIA